MTEPQIIKTPTGAELVVIPREDYEALLARAADADEDEADIAIYDARKAELAEGKADLLPPEVSAALLRGDTRLKAIRKWRTLSQGDVAAKANITQGYYLSDLENGRRAGTPETLQKLAEILGVSGAWLSF